MSYKSRFGRVLVVAAVMGLGLGEIVRGATYYVDYDGGKDDNSGMEVGAAWKHCPGDANATGAAKKAVLTAGDTVLFKGGVAYRGVVTVKGSGEAGKPLVLEGNSAGKFGTGAAVIEGSEPVTGWRVCKSAEECGGNPNWKSIYIGFVPNGTQVFTANLCDGGGLLKLAEDPNIEDAFYQDDTRSFVPTTLPLPSMVTDVKVVPGKQMEKETARPMHLLVDGNLRTSAILSPMVGADVKLELANAQTIVEVGIGQGAKGYQAGKDFEILSGGKEILKGTLKDVASVGGGVQKFKLDGPVVVKDLTLKITSAWTDKPNYGAVTELQGYDAKGENVLQAKTHMEYVKADYFTQADPHYWDGAYFATLARPNWMHYQKVVGFVPAEHKIEFATLDEALYDPKVHPEAARFAMFNAIGILDRPGEYWVSEKPEADGTQKVLLWPRKLGADGPEAVTCSVRKSGFIVEGSNYLTIEGFKFDRQAGDKVSAIDASKVSHLVVRDNEITELCAGVNRAGGIGVRDCEDGLITHNHLALNRGVSGIMVSRFNNGMVSENTLYRDGGTAIDFYDCHHSKLLKNVVTEHNGVHANGLTMYVGCSDILVEGNLVTDSNVCLTMQDGSDITVRYNVFDGHGAMPSIGLWSGKPLKNITIENNVCAHAAPNHEWSAAIFNGNKGGSGYVIKNNVIDGLAGDSFPSDTVFANNIYTQLGPWQKATKKEMGPGESLVTDLSKIFVDPGKLNFHLAKGSPAIGAGVDVGAKVDYDGTALPAGKAVDIGAFVAKP